MQRILWIAALLLALLPATALAAEPRSGSEVTVGPNETVNDDLYLAGGTINVQGTVQGDVVATGGTINITGNVAGGVIAAGGTINITGQVGRSVRAAGGSVTVNAPVGGDVVFAGGSLSLGRNARVTRDVMVGGGSVIVDGQVGRNLTSGSGELVVDGTVGGNIRSDGGTLRLGNSAVVNGSVSYVSSQEASIASGAQARGGIERRALPQIEPDPVLSTFVGWLRALVGLFVVGLLFVLLFPGVSRRSVENLYSSPWASLGIGLGLLIVVPIIALLAIIAGAFVGGWWVGLVVLAAYGIAIALSIPTASMLLGDWILSRAGRTGSHLLWGLLLGLVIVLLVSLVPYLGGIVLFVTMLFGLGAMAIAATRGPRAPAVASASLRAEPPPPTSEAAA